MRAVFNQILGVARDNIKKGQVVTYCPRTGRVSLAKVVTLKSKRVKPAKIIKPGETVRVVTIQSDGVQIGCLKKKFVKEFTDEVAKENGMTPEIAKEYRKLLIQAKKIMKMERQDAEGDTST